MPAYLKRLQIDSVEEVGVDTTATAYLKRVEIVEVVDSDGTPWEPVPGPDPFDELVVVQQTTWSESNVYAVGETISGLTNSVDIALRPGCFLYNNKFIEGIRSRDRFPWVTIGVYNLNDLDSL